MKIIKADNVVYYCILWSVINLYCLSKKIGKNRQGEWKTYLHSLSFLVTLFLFQMASLSNVTENVDFIPGLLLHSVQAKIVRINDHLSKPGQAGITNSCKLGLVERPLNIAKKQNFWSVYLPYLAHAKNSSQVSCLQRWILPFFLSLECISHTEEK